VIVELYVALTSAADDHVPKLGLDKKDGVVEAAVGAWEINGVLIEIEHGV
jgi:hypothetical protein